MRPPVQSAVGRTRCDAVDRDWCVLKVITRAYWDLSDIVSEIYREQQAVGSGDHRSMSDSHSLHGMECGGSIGIQ